MKGVERLLGYWPEFDVDGFPWDFQVLQEPFDANVEWGVDTSIKELL